jgi:hypothetical protein
MNKTDKKKWRYDKKDYVIFTINKLVLLVHPGIVTWCLKKKKYSQLCAKTNHKTKWYGKKSHIKTRFKKYKPGGQMGFPVSWNAWQKKEK